MNKVTCVFCGSEWNDPVYKHRGVCPPCKSRNPAFIPKAQYANRETYHNGNGYVARADGLVRYDLSAIAQTKGHAPQKIWTGLPPITLEPVRKRTPQERLDSLHQRLARTFANGAVPDSML